MKIEGIHIEFGILPKLEKGKHIVILSDSQKILWESFFCPPLLKGGGLRSGVGFLSSYA